MLLLPLPRAATRILIAAAALSAGAASADVVLPSSAFSSGQNNAEFHSDVRVFNPTSSPVDFTPIFYRSDANGNVVDTVQMPVVTIGPRQQRSYDNVLQSLFGQTIGVFGPIRFQTSAPLLVSSSVNNVNACGNGATSGQWLPGIDVGQALRAGTLAQLAASANGSGYRSNVAFMNPGAATASVTAKLRNGDGTLVGTFTLDPIPPNGFRQIGSLAAWLPNPNTITDTNLWLEFTSDQPVLSFASVINNASGDPFAIVMTAEPNVSSPAPVASYTVSASPATGQPVTFTDTSSNSPITQLWAFGDGATATSGAAVAHTYAAAGTYKSAHFVSNAGGTSAAAKDVVVTTAAPIAVTISATTTGDTKWTFVCQAGPCSGAGNNNVNLKVGQPYAITWTTPQSENKTHGIGGLAVLGIDQCDMIRSNLPCTINFTPTAAMLTSFGGPVFTYSCTQTQCAPTQSVHDGMTGTFTIVP